MIAPRPAVWRRAFFGALVLSLLLAGPASAHTKFDGSDPVDGSVIEASVEEIGLFFTEPARPVGEGFVALAEGRVREPASFAPNDDGTIWTLRFEPPLDDGEVGLRWTVQAPDAHPISGSIRFTIDAIGLETNSPSTTVTQSSTGRDDSVSAAGSAAPESTTLPPQSESSVEPVASEEMALDDFLTPNPPFPPLSAEGAAAGRFLGYGAAMLAVGGLVFIVAQRIRGRDLAVVLRLIELAAVGLLLGVVLELLGYLAQVGGRWTAVFDPQVINAELSTSFILALALRFGAAVMAGVSARTWRLTPDAVGVGGAPSIGDRRSLPVRSRAAAKSRRVDGSHKAGPARSGGNAAATVDPGLRSADSASWRWVRGMAIGVLVVACLFVSVSFTFDGHTVTRSNPMLLGLVDLVHVLAAAIWSGGLMAMTVVLTSRRGRGEPLRALDLAVGFSVPAAVGAVGAGLAGTVLTILIVNDWASLAFSPWGRLLMAKVVLVIGCGAAGAYNHFVLIPALRSRPEHEPLTNRFRRSVRVEAVGMVLVIAITALLTGSST